MLCVIVEDIVELVDILARVDELDIKLFVLDA